jgi:hypothetical protein
VIPILEANVRKNKHLASTIAAAMAVAMLAGTSAFAETRHREETRSRGNARETVRRERSSQTQERQRSDESRNYRRRESGSSTSEESRRPSTFRPEVSTQPSRETRRSDAYRNDGNRSDRNRSDRDRSYGRNRSDRDRSYDRNRSDRDRSYGRNDSYRNNDRSYGNRSYGNRGQAYRHSGRITNYSRYGGGYRVWVAGAPYPFYIPLSHWHRDRFRIGLTINLGGYWNPGGYYDYYDGYDYRATSRGDLRGVVESVDYGRDSFVVRNEASGSFVTVIARDRRARDVRPGDYVELSGSWTRSGLFSAYDVDYIDRDYRERY